MRYRHIFGPVPSRRLGMSLGLDIIPYKTCTFDCLYCECGKTTRRTSVRREYIDIGSVLAELRHYIEHNASFDFVTLSGSGEPLLNSRTGFLVSEIKRLYPELRIAVITNGALLSLSSVRKSLLPADVVLPSLDAARESSFRKINRPAKGITCSGTVKGLSEFRKIFRNEIWLEIFFARNVNDGREDLKSLKRAIKKIAPDRVQLNTVDRPTAYDGLEGLNEKELKSICSFLEHPRCEIISRFKTRSEIQKYRSDTENAILDTVKRRPMTSEDISAVLAVPRYIVNKFLAALEERGLILPVPGERGTFWKIREKA